MWVPDDYLDGLYQESVRNHSTNFNEEWKLTLKEKLCECLGTFPPFSDAFYPIILEEIEKPDYYRIRVEITTYHPLRVPIYLLIPKSQHRKKFPVVLALHGHGYGSKEIVGLLPNGAENLRKPGIHKNFAVELVKKGVVVVAPELIGFGDRKLQGDQLSKAATSNSCFSIASKLLLVGKTLPGLRVFECQRILDYLETRKELEYDKIGCLGFSGGGLVAAYTSVLDKRIQATVISGYANTFKGSIMASNHCLDNYIPGILKYGEMPELIGLMAPRPLFIEAGISDSVFPMNHVLEAYQKIKEIYTSFQAENALQSHFFDGEHEISGENSFHWLVSNVST